MVCVYLRSYPLALTTTLSMQVAFLADAHNVTEYLIINSDQTGTPLTPSTKYNWVPKGSKECTGTGYGDKRQYAVTPTTSATGEMLPLKVRIP